MTNTARRWLLAGAFTAAGIAGVAAYDAATHAAHADTKPGIVAGQGGLLCHDLPRHATTPRLPEKASARAEAVVAEVAADKPQQDEPADKPTTPPTPPTEPEPEPEPTTEPTPEPTTPAEPLDEPVTDDRSTDATPEPTPTETPVEVPPVQVPVEVPGDVITTPPPAAPVEPTPAPSEPVKPTPVLDVPVTLPATDAAPLPDADAPVAQPKPVPVPVPVLPVQLPVVIGPTAAIEPAATAAELPGAAIEEADPAPDCADTGRAIKLDRDLIRQLIDSLTAPATAPKVKAKPGCPDKPEPGPDATGCTGTATNTASTNQHHLHADLVGALPTPVLDRIQHVRARSTLPTSRHVAIEPGPA